MFHRSISTLKICVSHRPHKLIKLVPARQWRPITSQLIPSTNIGTGGDGASEPDTETAAPQLVQNNASSRSHAQSNYGKDHNLKAQAQTSRPNGVGLPDHLEPADDAELNEGKSHSLRNGNEHGANTASDNSGQYVLFGQPGLSIRFAVPRAYQGDSAPSLVHWKNLFEALRFPEDGDFSKARRALNSERSLAASFIGQGDVQGIAHRAVQLAACDKRLFSSILAGCLAESASFTLRALAAMKWIPGRSRTRSECLQYCRQFYSEEIENDPLLLELYNEELSKLRNPNHWPESGIQSVHLDMILQDLSTTDKKILIDKFLERYPAAAAPNLLYIVDCFVRLKDPEAALSVMRRLPQEYINRADQILIDRCILLLRLDTVEQTDAKHSFKILPALLEIGIRPNAIIHNIVVQNAVKAQLPGVAWDVFYYMQGEGIIADAGTHLALLKDSYLANNIPGINQIMTAINQRADLFQNPYIVAYTMHLVRINCFFDLQLNAQDSLSHILAIYDRAYDRAPLLRLDIVRKDVPMKKVVLPQPEPAGLAFTIWSIVLIQRQPRNVTRLWQELVRLIEQGDPHILEAAKYDAFYSGFIIFYLRNQTTLSEGLAVLQYMLDLGLVNPHENTWNAAVCAFLKYNLESTAERIWELMMSRRGSATTAGAWQVMLEKYPRTKLAETVRSMLEAREMPGDIVKAVTEEPVAKLGDVDPE